MLHRLLRGKAEVRVLGVVLFKEGLHLREIARMANVSPYEAKKELDIFVEIGLLHSERKGNQVIFYTKPECPFLLDLKNLYRKTEGIFNQLKNNLGGIYGIKYCFVFGSMAHGHERRGSDIDLMVIGSVDEDLVAGKIMNIQKDMSREINFILWTENDFKDKIRTKGRFLQNMIQKDLVFLIGDKDEFIRIIEKGHGKKG